MIVPCRRCSGGGYLRDIDLAEHELTDLQQLRMLVRTGNRVKCPDCVGTGYHERSGADPMTMP